MSEAGEVSNSPPLPIRAMELLSRNSSKNFREFADLASADLLVKHHWPRTQNDALES